jgi:hypothetical protein
MIQAYTLLKWAAAIVSVIALTALRWAKVDDGKGNAILHSKSWVVLRGAMLMTAEGQGARVPSADRHHLARFLRLLILEAVS